MDKKQEIMDDIKAKKIGLIPFFIVMIILYSIGIKLALLFILRVIYSIYELKNPRFLVDLLEDRKITISQAIDNSNFVVEVLESIRNYIIVMLILFLYFIAKEGDVISVASMIIGTIISCIMVFVIRNTWWQYEEELTECRKVIIDIYKGRKKFSSIEEIEEIYQLFEGRYLCVDEKTKNFNRVINLEVFDELGINAEGYKKDFLKNTLDFMKNMGD